MPAPARSNQSSLDSALVSKAAKRERQRLNREAQRQYRETLARRRRRLKLARNLTIVGVPVIALLLVFDVFGSAGPAAIKRRYTSAPAMTIDPAKTYVASIETTEGTMVLSLDAKAAPTSVNNFVFLARRRYYDGLTFHRVVKDFVIQGGSPKGTGIGGPGYTVTGEVPADGYHAGTVAWAKTESEPAGTAGSQFFVVLTDEGASPLNDQPYLYGYIGKVVSGLDVARNIGKLEPNPAPSDGNSPPKRRVTIERILISTAGGATTTTTPPSS